MEEVARLIRENYRPLSKDEERAAWERGDFESLVNAQLKIVMLHASKVVTRMGRTDLLEEAFSIGLTELFRIVQVFNPDRGRLSTIACFALSAKIFREMQPLRDVGGIRRAVQGKDTGRYCISVHEVGTEDVEFDVEDWRDWFGGFEASDIFDVETLTDVEREVLRRKSLGESQEEIGKALAMGKPRIRRCEDRGRGKVRNSIEGVRNAGAGQ
jgi:DNA-directed RNA polymerase specialized sigma subunit